MNSTLRAGGDRLYDRVGLDDPLGLRLVAWLTDITGMAGLVLLWVAGLLTLMTGWDYFAKSLPFLQPEPGE